MLCLCIASAALYCLRIILRVDTGGGSAQVMREDMRNDGVSRRPCELRRQGYVRVVCWDDIPIFHENTAR